MNRYEDSSPESITDPEPVEQSFEPNHVKRIQEGRAIHRRVAARLEPSVDTANESRECGPFKKVLFQPSRFLPSGSGFLVG